MKPSRSASAERYHAKMDGLGPLKPTDVLHYLAFAQDVGGGNPAGVVPDARGLSDGDMLQIASTVGYSETAFVFPLDKSNYEVRYFSPRIEVPFCGHATIASAVALAEGSGVGDLYFKTRAGAVRITTERELSGAISATLTSVPPQIKDISAEDLGALLQALRWRPEDLDRALPVRSAYAGAWHPIIAANSRDRLSNLDYDFEALSEVTLRNDWATVNLVWREHPLVFHARNPFPLGGVVEDPATGAAAAALGGYLRELRLVDMPGNVTVYQGADMGRPSLIKVGIPSDSHSGIEVTGGAIKIAPLYEN
jgi:PhzF family phenazine biosynthesis protein